MNPNPESTEKLLDVKALTKLFGEVIANKAVDFEVQHGEIHCLLGENGAGKTTLMECIYGFYGLESGEIRFMGDSVNIKSPSDAIELGIGMVHQHYELVETHSILENIILGIHARGILIDVAAAETHLKDLCKQYDVDLDPHQIVWQLSIGEKQWVEILKALYEGVQLLILDEPTAVLTPQEADKLFATLKEMRRKGLSIVLVTHKLNEVMEISDRVTVLRKGKLVGTVNTSDVTKQDLARMMVGRDVLFRINKDEHQAGEKIFEIEDLLVDNDMGHQALCEINFDLYQGEILALAGVSGNGQKELFEVMVGVRGATGGDIRLDNESILGSSPREIGDLGIVHIPSDRMAEGLVLDFSIKENLILGLHWSPPVLKGARLDRPYIDQFAEMSISAFDIVAPSIDHPTRSLSGGNMQKVILARELQRSPRVLLANQPCRGLDVGVIEFIHGLLLEKRREGVAIFLISEDLDEIFTLADRIAVIYEGEITGIYPVAESTVEQIGLAMAGEKDVEL